MKKTILMLTASLLITGGIVTGCNTPAEKVEKAQQEVDEANNKLDKVTDEYQADIAKYRLEATKRIAANEKSIAEFNARIDDQKKVAKADYTIKIAELEKKNTDMKKKMDDYKEDGKDKWEKFKLEFNHDLEELGKAFKDLTVKNVQ